MPRTPGVAPTRSAATAKASHTETMIPTGTPTPLAPPPQAGTNSKTPPVTIRTSRGNDRAMKRPINVPIALSSTDVYRHNRGQSEL
jgi:hypothetical protein